MQSPGGSHCLFWLSDSRMRRWEARRLPWTVDTFSYSAFLPAEVQKRIWWCVPCGREKKIPFSVCVCVCVVMLIKSLPKSHWNKLTGLKGSWLHGHLVHEILKTNDVDTQKDKGYLHTADNSTSKWQGGHLTNCLHVHLFDSFGLIWKWNRFQKSLSLFVLSSSKEVYGCAVAVLCPKADYFC